MSCTPVTAEMADLLERLRRWPDVDTAELQRRPEWEQARAWGWVMESGELTGLGFATFTSCPGGSSLRTFLAEEGAPGIGRKHY